MTTAASHSKTDRTAPAPRSAASPFVPRSYSALAAVGPWVLTVFALLLISKLVTQIQGEARVEEIRGIVIYAFMLSLVTSGPVALIATRMLSDDILRGALERCASLILGAIVLAAVATVLLAAVVFGLVLRTPFAVGIVATALSILITMVWIAVALCAAVEDYGHIMLAFATGLAIAVLGTVVTAHWTSNPMTVEAAFLPGIAIIFYWLVLRLLATFPQQATSLWPSIALIVRGLAHYRVLAIGSLIGGIAIWIDKWILWHSQYGVVTAGGLVQAPHYDSPMFVAYIGVLPSLWLLIATLQTSFYERYKSYYALIESHGTLEQIRGQQAMLSETAVTMILRIVLLQCAISIIMVLMAPRLIEFAGLEFAQLSVLRFGTLGALFQFVFVACSAVIVFFNQQARFAWLQVLYLVLLVVATLATVGLGTEYLGLGYLVASVIAGLASFVVLETTLRELNYLTFIVANASRPKPP